MGGPVFFLLTGGTGRARLIIFMEWRSEPSGSMINMNRQEMTIFDIMTKLFPKDGKVGAVGGLTISGIWLGKYFRNLVKGQKEGS